MEKENWESEFQNLFQSFMSVKYPKNGGEQEMWKVNFILRQKQLNEKHLVKIKSFISSQIKQAEERGAERIVKIIRDEKEKYEPAYEDEDIAIVTNLGLLINLINQNNENNKRR